MFKSTRLTVSCSLFYANLNTRCVVLYVMPIHTHGVLICIWVILGNLLDIINPERMYVLQMASCFGWPSWNTCVIDLLSSTCRNDNTFLFVYCKNPKLDILPNLTRMRDTTDSPKITGCPSVLQYQPSIWMG